MKIKPPNQRTEVRLFGLKVVVVVVMVFVVVLIFVVAEVVVVVDVCVVLTVVVVCSVVGGEVGGKRQFLESLGHLLRHTLEQKCPKSGKPSCQRHHHL